MHKKKVAIYFLCFFIAFLIYIFFGGMNNEFNRLKEGNTSVDGQIIEEGTEKIEITTTEDKMVENNKQIENDCVDDAMEKNINPYFFSEDVYSAEYEAKFDFKDGEDGIVGEAELSISKVNIFQKGILYKLRVKSDTEAFDEKGILVKRDNCLGYFYVEAERISFIRSNEMELGVTEKELVNMGTVVCQSESWKENRITSGTKGWHGRIEVIEDKCFFWGYNDLEESEYDQCYEYFIWQKGKGLVGYRRGRGENEEMYLYMEGMEAKCFSEDVKINPYFFPEGVTTVTYDGYFHFKERNLRAGNLERGDAFRKNNIKY